MEEWLYWLYGNLPAYQSNFSKIEQAVKKSDVLITDGTHRIVGLFYNRENDDSPRISVQCIRQEVAFAKQVAFNNRIKIITDKELSASLFSRHNVGDLLKTDLFRPVAKIYARLKHR